MQCKNRIKCVINRADFMAHEKFDGLTFWYEDSVFVRMNKKMETFINSSSIKKVSGMKIASVQVGFNMEAKEIEITLQVEPAAGQMSPFFCRYAKSSDEDVLMQYKQVMSEETDCVQKQQDNTFDNTPTLLIAISASIFLGIEIIGLTIFVWRKLFFSVNPHSIESKNAVEETIELPMNAVTTENEKMSIFPPDLMDQNLQSSSLSIVEEHGYETAASIHHENPQNSNLSRVEEHVYETPSSFQNEDPMKSLNTEKESYSAPSDLGQNDRNVTATLQA
ncbi:uncharacterized protein LOC106073114 isoform X2 [Biomphalaria glabrata]|nr:uncharacterized protein LOC106073114 isoform X2 [Biomphalaria glabrata]XP_055864886.1 uncharacterized protein LOC106073114 isoform X2 [Biomphalaria glabrata]XP_055864887.1 uncharacterized protein LOC106073114 isoform X2 [Biomphalaria glabrata]